jgi:four helix bundle protein
LKTYKDLDIYQISYDLALKVHNLSQTLPPYELYEEGSQVRRSSKGVTAAIVEGYGRRQYKADFIKFLIYSQASCDETMVHLQFIKDTHKEKISEIIELISFYEELGKKINRFITYVQTNWKSTRNP